MTSRHRFEAQSHSTLDLTCTCFQIAIQEVRGGERARSHACQVDLKIDVVRRVACIGNDHGVAATLVIAGTVCCHRTWRGYQRCITGEVG